MTSRTETLAARIEERFKEKMTRMPSTCGELTYELSPDDLIEVCTTLRDEEPFKLEMLMDLCGVDYLQYGEVEWKTESATDTGYSRGVSRNDPMEATGVAYDPEYQNKPRFAVVYHLLSVTNNHRLRLRAFCPDDTVPMIDSVIQVWASADWYEREAFDLFGILFNGHPDLRRLLTDYGFIGHPFRRDFPLIGNVEVRYDPEEGRVVYQPVSIEPRTLVPKVIRHDHRYEPTLKE